MRVSIITAAFRAQYMPRVQASIERQTYPDWEWMIVNDGQQEIRNWYNEFNRNAPENTRRRTWFIDLERQRGRFGLYTRNIGMMANHNERFVFLDDDNEWTEDHLESLVALEQKTGKTPYCWMHIKGKKPGSTHEKIKATGFSRQGIDLGCILYKREFPQKYGYFEDVRQVTFDFELMEKIFHGEGGSDHFVCTEKPTLIFWHKRY